MLLKEYVAPTQSNIVLFFLGPVITLVFSLLGFSVIPLLIGLTTVDINLNMFFVWAVSYIGFVVLFYQLMSLRVVLFLILFALLELQTEDSLHANFSLLTMPFILSSSLGNNSSIKMTDF